MIDPIETKTRIVNGAGGTLSASWALSWIFTADDDLTLRSVSFGGSPQAILSTDPMMSLAIQGKTQNDFQLSSYVKADWTNLVFPVPKGTRLYYGINQLANDQLITLIFT